MRAVLVVVPLLLPAALSGCVALAGAAVGAAAAYGAIKYTQNGAYRDFEAGFDHTLDTTTAALSDMGYRVPADSAQGAPAKLRFGDVAVDVEPRGLELTRVTVRVGTFQTEAHEARATAILEAIADRFRGA